MVLQLYSSRSVTRGGGGNFWVHRVSRAECFSDGMRVLGDTRDHFNTTVVTNWPRSRAVNNLFTPPLAASRGGVIFEVCDGFVRPSSECLSTRTFARYH